MALWHPAIFLFRPWTHRLPQSIGPSNFLETAVIATWARCSAGHSSHCENRESGWPIGLHHQGKCLEYQPCCAKRKPSECPRPPSGRRAPQSPMQESSLARESLQIDVLKRFIPATEQKHNATLGWISQWVEIKCFLLGDEGSPHVAIALVIDSDALLAGQ